MKRLQTVLPILTMGILGLVGGCQSDHAKSPDVKDAIQHSLEQSGLQDVTVSQDREKGVVTLGGTVASDSQKLQAETIARSIATAEVVSNQIGVRPPGAESAAKDIDSALDDSIDKSIEAELLQHKLQNQVKYGVKNGVVTLRGTVNSPSRRSYVEKVVAATPNVKQVVNELEIKNQKATSSPGVQ